MRYIREPRRKILGSLMLLGDKSKSIPVDGVPVGGGGEAEAYRMTFRKLQYYSQTSATSWRRSLFSLHKKRI